MPAKRSNTTNYFPHPANDPLELEMIEQEFGDSGYMVWYRLKEFLCKCEDHFFNINGDRAKLYLTKVLKTDPDKLINILEVMAELNVIDKNLWNDGVIWWQGLVDDFSDVYLKRNRSTPERPDHEPILTQTDSIPNQGEPKSNHVSPQSKAEQSKANKNKAEYLPAFQKLLSVKMPAEKARNLANGFSAEYIDLKILYWQCRVETSKTAIEKPMGYLIDYIKKDWPAPAGFDDWLDRQKRR